MLYKSAKDLTTFRVMHYSRYATIVMTSQLICNSLSQSFKTSVNFAARSLTHTYARAHTHTHTYFSKTNSLVKYQCSIRTHAGCEISASLVLIIELRCRVCSQHRLDSFPRHAVTTASRGRRALIVLRTNFLFCALQLRLP